MKFTRRILTLTAITCAALAATGTALAQFPDKPMKIVVGAPAGGTADIVARTLSEGLAQQLGQSVIVDNKPGAAGMIGLQELMKSPRDGHTMMVSVNGLLSEIPHAMKLPVDPMKELRPVAELARTGLLFVGGPNVPASNVKEAVAYIKANPGKINYASYSPGTLSHTLGLEFNKLAGTDMVHVGYKGSPPALTDLIGGHVSFMFDGPATSIPMIKGGKIKVFATTSPTRLSMLPDVPTFAELGYKDLTETAWMGLFVSPDVPAAAQARLREAVMKVLEQPAVRQRFAGMGLDMVPSASADELARSLRAASDRQVATLKAVGFKPE
ncbi:MAG: tripartite tricarboxylate transporter substrate binding protein [Burkholderiaceae bacterium]|jgi:tripartite-type tricarboxylate transporter receptor subunit TctC|nr:tripartite tricarboxylate transporter substrate binding protein [Burkholderiaceae bacterium]